MFTYDPAILTAVQTSPQSVADVLGTMRAIDAACIDGDGLKWFNWLYLRVTEAVEARLASGGFTDPAWLAQLDVQFARLYFGALKAALSGQSCPGCWWTLFDSRNRPAVARIQFALAGINAHINHDLCQAIVATCRASDCPPQHTSAQYKDYTALNQPWMASLNSLSRSSMSVFLATRFLPCLTWRIRSLLGA